MKPTKTLTALLAVPLVLGMTACSKPVEITASSRKDAMDKCMAESTAAARQANQERARAKADPKSADSDTNPNFYDDYEYTFLLDSEWETVEITQVYCKPQQINGSTWSNVGYLEYIVTPTEKSFDVSTKVERVMVSYGYNWNE